MCIVKLKINFMAKLSCLQPLKMSSYVLSKCGLLFTREDITNLDILKIILNTSFAVVGLILVILNVGNGMITHNMTLINWSMCVLIPLVYYLAKQFTLLINRKYLLSLLSDLSSDTFNSHAEELNSHVQNINTITNVMLKCSVFAGVVLVIVTCILPVAINMRMMIPSPFHTGRFDILYKFFHLFAVTYLGMNAIIFDIFYLTLMASAVAQLNILQERLLNVFEGAQNMKARIYNYENVSAITGCILKECFVQHQMIISFIAKLSILVSFPLFAQYTCGCFTICNTIVRLLIMGETDTTSVISNLSYSSVIFTEITAYHWLANEIIYKSNKIVESCYLSNWYEMDVKSQKSLLPLMERAQRPLVVRLYNFVDVSLESLGMIVRWSYSIFALVKARYS